MRDRESHEVTDSSKNTNTNNYNKIGVKMTSHGIDEAIRKKSISFQPVDVVVTDASPSLEPHDQLDTFEEQVKTRLY